jgi:hypothetical protein
MAMLNSELNTVRHLQVEHAQLMQFRVMKPTFIIYLKKLAEFF